MNKSPQTSGGYVLNLSGFKKPVQIYLNYICRPSGYLRDFLRRNRLGVIAKIIEYFVRKGLHVLLGWFHANDFDVDFSKYEQKTLGLSKDKNNR
jgi:hypothetical protein